MERDFLHQDTLVLDTLDKMFGSLQPRDSGLPTQFINLLVWPAYWVLFLPWYLVFSLYNFLRPVRPLSISENYILFLPNLGQNLAGMFEMVKKLSNINIVVTCPHTVPRARLEKHSAQANHKKLQVLSLHWLRFIHFKQLGEYIQYGLKLLQRYGNSDLNSFRLIFLLVKFTFYGLATARMRDMAFDKILARAPGVIVSARPKSHYGNLPFLHAARLKQIPAYYLAHTHIDASDHFRYQVFRPGLFSAFFLPLS